jgi:hypothetical protein
MVYKLKCGSTSLPSLLFCLLWILSTTDGNVGLTTDASHFAVVALGTFWDAGDGLLHFS